MMVSHSSRRSGFTLVELLAVSAAVSLLGVQIFPSIFQSREAARRTQCKNNLKMIGLALYNYHDSYRLFPIGWEGVDLETKKSEVFGSNGWGWAARITPYIDQAPLYNKFDFNARIDEGENAKLIANPINELICPSDPFAKKTWKIPDENGTPVVELAKTNYVGSFGTADLTKCEKMKPGEPCLSNGAFQHNRCVSIANITDGTSNTLCVGERVGSSRVDLQACKLEYSIVSPK